MLSGRIGILYQHIQKMQNGQPVLVRHSCSASLFPPYLLNDSEAFIRYSCLAVAILPAVSNAPKHNTHKEVAALKASVVYILTCFLPMHQRIFASSGHPDMRTVGSALHMLIKNKQQVYAVRLV